MMERSTSAIFVSTKLNVNTILKDICLKDIQRQYKGSKEGYTIPDMMMNYAEEAQTERVHAFINHEQLNPLTYYKEPGMCISFRESQRCRGGPTCPYTHEGATNKICTDEDYIRYGFCSNWYDCKNQHPYDAIKFGPRSIMLEKYREMRRKKQAGS